MAIRKYKIQNKKEDPSVTEKKRVGYKKRILANSKYKLCVVGLYGNKEILRSSFFINSLIQHLHFGIPLLFIALGKFSLFCLYTEYLDSKKCF